MATIKDPPAAFSLLAGVHEDIDAVCVEATKQCRVDRSQIEDILPSSSSQHGVVASVANNVRIAVRQAFFQVEDDIDLERLFSAWSEVVRLTPALRSRIFIGPSGSQLQAVLSEEISWKSVTGDADEAATEERTSAAVPGAQCNKYAIITKPTTKERFLIWTFGCAFVDDAVLRQVLKQVVAAHDGDEVQKSAGTEHVLRHITTLGGMDESPWMQRDVEGASFPPLPTNLTKPSACAHAEHRIAYTASAPQTRSTTTICQAALAVLLSRYTRAAEVAFDVLVERPLVQPCSVDGPTRSIFPRLVQLDPQQSRADLMRKIEEQHTTRRRLEQAGFHTIESHEENTDVIKISSQTVLAVTSSEDEQARVSNSHRATPGSDIFAPHLDRALLLECRLGGDSLSLGARYDPGIIDDTQIHRFLRQLAALIEQFRGDVVDLSIQDLDATTQEDREEIKNWNLTAPPAPPGCIHHMIAKWTTSSPQHPAVSAWDGDLTHAELDDLSSRLALYIQSFNLGAECVVPLCFEKSKWTVITELAILKAGVAFTLVDPSLPINRIDTICRQVSATMAFVGESQRHTLEPVVSDCIVVDDALLQSLPLPEQWSHPIVKPQNLAYIIFTSGSTGEPKGSMVEHQGITSYASVLGPAFRIDQNTRTLQFASYAYAVCMTETFGTLLVGGCVCIPSEHDRMNDISGFIHNSRVNFAILTPSFIGAVQPENVPSLEVLMMAGEPMKRETRDIWAGRVQLLNGYGQSECFFSGICPVDADTPDVRIIGRGFGSRLWIVEPGNSDRLAPVGCPGELMSESNGVARGYLGLPEVTASKFLTKGPLWYPQGCEPLDSPRFYKTGDLACYQSDGTVLVLGREDSQVKIRGQRLELGEVEFHLRKIMPPDVTPLVTTVNRSHAPRREVLMAFLVGPLDRSEQATDPVIIDHATASHFTAQMENQLGRHAIPSYYVHLKDLPTTATGKTNRKKLQTIGVELLEAMDQDVASRTEESRPTDGPEAAMAELWSQSMPIGTGSIGMRDNFFDLGGDSIIAISMANKARASGLRLTVADILQNPVFADLVAATGQESIHGTEEETIPIQSRDSDEAELSSAQKGLWFLEQLNPGTPAYNVSIAGRLRGPLRLDALQTALRALEQRHEILRTTFKERSGTPVQVIRPCRPAEDTLQLIDIAADTDFREELQRQQITAFDLQSSPPWRIAVLRLGADDHVLSIVMHHIISDGWSDDLLRRSLEAFYSAAVAGREPLVQLDPLVIQYRDFAAWQQHSDQQAEQQRQLRYWTEQLTDSTPAELPIDKPRPPLPSGRASVVETTIDGPLFRLLQRFCKAQQTTPYVVLLAAFRAAHFRLTDAEDATIGTPNAGRIRTELEDLIGFFSNTQCMRIRIEGETFAELVQQVKATVTAALAHQDEPFERVVSGVLPGFRDASRNPLVQLMFAVHSQPTLGEIHLEGLEGETLPGTESTRFDMEFHLVQRAEEIRGTVLFAEELFEPETILATVDTFKEVLRLGIEQPTVPMPSLHFANSLPELQSKGVIDIASGEYPRDSSIVSVFAEQVATHPRTIAVKDSSTQLTYAELDGQSTKLATWLRRRKFAAETWVGVLAPRSCQTIVAFLGILKANLAYVPLDIEAPAGRVEGILSAFEGEKLILLGADTQAPDTCKDGTEFVRISEAVDSGDQEHVQATAIQPSATSLAYVMFTSGSTGKPKGVMIEHRGVVRLVKQTNVLSELPSALAVAHLFNIAFDLSVWELYAALLNGGTVVCIDSATKQDPNALAQVFTSERIQAAMLPPALLKTCLANTPDMFKGLAAFYNGADRFDRHDAISVRRLVPGRVVNAYGPTENSALSTVYDVRKDDTLTNGVPIGHAISNSGAYVMDAHQNLVPLGVMGELVVTGDGLARGYTDPSLDRDRFVEVKIHEKQVKAYRTGDRVRYRPKDGQIEFFGRMDGQVKIRGFRVEMAEVERAILGQDEVDDALVVVHQDKGGDANLIGFITTQKDTAVGQEEASGGQVESWGQQFDNNFYAGIEDIDPCTVGSDFLGWTSMYDGSKIDRSEMKEWLNDSMQTMLDGQAAGRVLEIGTGTGMVLFNLGEGLQNYVGIDPSKSSVDFASDKIREIPGLADKAKINVGTASNIDQIDSQGSELVVLNSVIQYFPSPEYLFEVIEAVARLPHAQRLFVGDVRSYPLNRQFLASRALFKLGEEASKTDIRREMTRMEDGEEELLVNPAFFTALPGRLPSFIHHVEILPKMMTATNELSSYRYAAIIHFKRSSQHVQEVYTLDGHQWVDFRARNMDRGSLTQFVRDSRDSPLVAISNIPWSKTIEERHVVEALDEEQDSEGTDEAAWVPTAKSSAKSCPSLSATDLIEVARQTGFRVEVSWSRQSSQNGGLDAIFHRCEPSGKGARVKFRFPSDDDGPSAYTLPSNRPLRSLRNRQIETRVRNALQRLLPSYMIPRRVMVLDRMPLNANGKVDRKELSRLAGSAMVPNTTTSRVNPQNEDERALCEEFSSVLGVDVSPVDSFFELGGHSLMAMRLLPKVRDRLGWHILVRDLYTNDTPRALYTAQTRNANATMESGWPSFMEVHSRGSKSRATLVLIHGFWGQGRIFAGLTPFLNEHLDVIILHDPFFGKPEGPQSLDEWSDFYLEALQTRLPRDARVILGGYSFGSFTALQMASAWKRWSNVDLVSLLLLDPAVWEPVNIDELSQEFLDEKVNYGLRLFGDEQRDYVMEHFKKFGPLMASPKTKPHYEGEGLHIASSEVAEQGVPQWWANNYPNLQQQCIDATHHGLFEWSTAVEQVGKAINEHCSRIWSRGGE
ncbi:hypothetical protein PRZ48_007865 [Zasmidium cellare]|uniref:Carrier domain-containing protein n=1 Tax=Zasmidium cellare TaxID=395010 RepID=A0ABR0EKF8_ZASCE|nr:hypothetical protein PRZ48_007865 [Zasmidium cellare]